MRRLAAGLGVLIVLALGTILGAGSAAAAPGDAFDRMDVAYVVGTDGVLHVKETIVLRFGGGSGRHGLERYWVTREPYDDERDAVYRITNLTVTSPSGVSTQVDQTNQGSGRLRSTRLRVGSPDQTISAATATYVLTYDVIGAMRTSPGYDEFYWDVTGSGFPRIVAATVSVTVPGGVQEVTCSVAAAGKRGRCKSATITGGVAQFVADGIPASHILTVSTRILPGLITDNGPHLEENADLANQRLGTGLLIGSGIAAAIVPVLGWLYYRKHGPDRRFVGLPAGVLPPPGQSAPEAPDPGYQVPVAFAPPKLPLADAGLLLTGQNNVRQTTATLVGLAVAGAIKLRSDDSPEARLLDREAARDAQQTLLLREIFPRNRKKVVLDDPGVLTEAHDALVKAAAADAVAGGWFFRRTVWGGIATFAFPALTLGVIGFFGIGIYIVLAAPLLISVAATLWVLTSKLRRGQRTGVGRALTDQVEGFRTYLATAEADQLRFEEGEDIFSKYLPWAVLFDLTDRWATVCEQLVAMGRLSAAAPGWYYGTSWDWGHSGSDFGQMNDHVSSGVSTPSSVSSGTGFGGGSSFGGGGGFSGGGGGGGGGGSW